MLLEKILCRIPLSLKIDGKIFSNSDICEGYIKNRMLFLRTSSIFFGDNNPFLLRDSLVSEELAALDSCSILHNLFSLEKSKPQELMKAIHKHMAYFLQSSMRPSVMCYSSIYNRCYVLLEYLHYTDNTLESSQLLRKYIIEKEIPDLKAIPLSSGFGNDILRLTALYIYGRQFSDSDAKHTALVLLMKILKQNLDCDNLPFTSIENLFFYTTLLINLRNILDGTYCTIEKVLLEIVLDMEQTCSLLTNGGNFPPIDIYRNRNRTSHFSEKEGSRWFKKQGLFVFHHKEIFIFIKSVGTVPSIHADNNSIIYKYDSIDILTEYGCENNFQRETSPSAHTMPVHKSYLFFPAKEYFKFFQHKTSGIKHVETSEGEFNIITVSAFDNLTIKRTTSFNDNNLIFKDVIEGDIKDYCANFCIPSAATDIAVDKSRATYNISGLHVNIIASDGVAQIKTYPLVNDIHHSFNSIEFSKSDKKFIQYTVTIDKSQRDNFLIEQKLFLDQKMFSAVRDCVENHFIDNLFNFCNLSAIVLYRYGREMYLRGNFKESHRIEVLNKIINNCSIKSSCKIGEKTTIAYGGLGVLIHADSIIGKSCNIGSNVTLAAAPKIGNYCYLGTGCRVIKYQLSIGDFCIIGANAVVTHDIPPCCVVSGIPGKIVKKITPINIDKYIPYFAWEYKYDSTYVAYIKDIFLKYYEKINNT